MTLRTLNYGNYGIFLIMGNAGFRPSAVLYTWAKVLVGLARQKRHAPGRNHRHLCGYIEALLAPENQTGPLIL